MSVHPTPQYNRLKTLLDRPIAFNRAFVTITGGVLSGLMLAQAFYWHPRSTHEDNWFFKTQADWEAETGMSRWEQETARKKLRAVISPSGLHLWEEERRGIPAKLFYRINLDALEELLFAPLPGANSDSESDSGEAAIKYVGIPHTEEFDGDEAQIQQTSALDSRNQACSDPTIKNDGLARSITETTSDITTKTTTEKRDCNGLRPLQRPAPTGALAEKTTAPEAEPKASLPQEMEKEQDLATLPRSVREDLSPAPPRNVGDLRKHVAIVAFHDLHDRYPSKSQMKIIVEADPPIALWVRAIRAWAAAGYNPTNIEGMLDWAFDPSRYEHTHKDKSRSAKSDGKRSYSPEIFLEQEALHDRQRKAVRYSGYN